MFLPHKNVRPESTTLTLPRTRRVSNMNFSIRSCALLVSALAAVPAFATNSFDLGIQRTGVFVQTSVSAPAAASPTGAAFFFVVDPPTANTGTSSYDSGTVDGQTLSPGVDSGGNPQLESTEFTFATVADMTTMFPNAGATYTYNLADSSDATQNGSFTLVDSSTGSSAGIAGLDSPSYTALQGMDPASALNLNFSSLNSGGNFDEAVILDSLHNEVPGFFFFGGATATGFSIPASTLQGGSQYTLVMFFGNELFPSNGFVDITNETKVAFSTQGATPEPATWLLAGTALAALGAGFRKSRLPRR